MNSKWLLAIAVLAYGSCAAGQLEAEQYEPNGMWYTFFKSKRKWGDARVFCEDTGGVLPSVHSDGLVLFLYRLGGSEPLQEAWLGASRTPQTWFVYEDGSAFAFEAWLPGEPSQDFGDNCLRSGSKKYESCPIVKN